MGFTKFMSVEASEVVTPEGHEAISDELNKLGKTSARDLSPEERESVNRGLEQARRGELSNGPKLDV